MLELETSAVDVECNRFWVFCPNKPNVEPVGTEENDLRRGKHGTINYTDICIVLKTVRNKW